MRTETGEGSSDRVGEQPVATGVLSGAAEPLLDRYLGRLGVELAARRLPERKSSELLAEIRHHLECAVEAGRREGEPTEVAAARALSTFGPAEIVAAEWVAADRVTLPTNALGLASAAGTMLGAALGAPAGLWVLPYLGGELMLPVGGCVLGLALGLLQWLLMRRVVATRAGWILGTALGAAAGLTGGTVVVELIGFEKGALAQELTAMALVGGVAGSAVSWLQWRLGLPSLDRPRAWVAGNALALAAGLVGGTLLAVIGFGDFRAVAGLMTLTVMASCSLGCAGSLLSRRALFGER